MLPFRQASNVNRMTNHERSASLSMPKPFEGPWVAVQRNPNSGSGAGQRLLLDFVRRLKQGGVRPRIFSDRAELDRAVTDPQKRSTLQSLVAAGGDGTIRDLLRRHPNIPLGFLPLGTENLIARWLGVPRCGRRAAEIVLAGRKQSFDLGSFHLPNADKKDDFAIMLSAGLDAEVIHRLHENRHGPIRRWHYFPLTFRTILRYRHSPLRVYLDDNPEPVIATLVVVANLPPYAMKLPVVPTANGQDGLLDIRCFSPTSILGMVKTILDVRLSRHEHLPAVGRFRARRIRLESDEPIPLQADGDAIGMTPVEITIRPTAVEWIVP